MSTCCKNTILDHRFNNTNRYQDMSAKTMSHFNKCCVRKTQREMDAILEPTVYDRKTGKLITKQKCEKLQIQRANEIVDKKVCGVGEKMTESEILEKNNKLNANYKFCTCDDLI